MLRILHNTIVTRDDPIVVRPMAVPEPNQRGLGWGSATLP